VYEPDFITRAEERQALEVLEVDGVPPHHDARANASTHASSNATAAIGRTTDREPGYCIPVHPFQL
jgi:hypothetical protein